MKSGQEETIVLKTRENMLEDYFYQMFEIQASRMENDEIGFIREELLKKI